MTTAAVDRPCRRQLTNTDLARADDTRLRSRLWALKAGVSGRSHSEKSRQFYAVFGISAWVNRGPVRLDRWLLGLTCLARLFGGCPPVGQTGMSVLSRPP